VRDSAGIEIVEISGATLESLPEWTLTREPILSIGEIDGEEPYLFSQIRSVRPLSDGGYAIVDRLARDIRIFDSTGRFVRRMGGAGEGPDEFATDPVIEMHVDGGILAYDSRQSRVTRFDASGELAETWLWPRDACEYLIPGRDEASPCRVGGVLSDGTLVLLHDRSPAFGAITEGQVFDNLRLRFGVGDQNGYREAGSAPLPPATVVSRLNVLGARQLALERPMLSGAPWFIVGQGRFAVIFRDRYEIHLFDRTGTFLRIVRVHLDQVRM